MTSQMARASPSLSLSSLVSSSALQQEALLVKWMAKNKQLNVRQPFIAMFVGFQFPGPEKATAVGAIIKSLKKIKHYLQLEMS